MTERRGADNCWKNNINPRGVTSDPTGLPECGGLQWPRQPDLVKSVSLLLCASWSRTNHHPWGRA